MLYHYYQFSDLGLDDSAARNVARRADELFNQTSKVLYGRQLTSGLLEGFSSAREASDTHVGLVTLIEPLGKLTEPSISRVYDPSNIIDTDGAQLGELVASLRAEVATLRQRLDQANQPKFQGPFK